ncbi:MULTISPECIES: efflux RND transporter periplasmic adaptor subunit [Chitinophagaceae]
MKKLCLYILMLVFLFACKEKKRLSEISTTPHEEDVVTLNDTQLKNSGVIVGYPEMKNIQVEIKVTGTVDVPPTNLVSVSFPMGGYVKSIHLLPGMEVHKGEVIATMEDQAYVQMQQDYLTTKAQLAYLATDLKRQKTLSEADAASQKNYQLIQSQYETQSILLNALGEKLKIIHIDPKKLTSQNITIDRPVYAPINGYVTQVNVNIGQYATPSEVLFSLINPDDIHAAMTVFEKDLPSFKIGMEGRVFTNGDTAKQYPVKVILVTKSVDSAGKGLVHCHFEKEDFRVAPGTFLNGIFKLSSTNIVAVPDDAVVRYFGKNYVFTTQDGKKFKMEEAAIGSSNEGFTALLPKESLDWKQTKVAVQGAYSLIGALKNKMEDE